MSPRDQAAAIFRGIRNNPAAIAAQRANHDALIASITGTNGGMQIIKADVNGQEFWAKHTSTPQDRLAVSAELMKMLDAGTAGSKTVIGRFA